MRKAGLDGLSPEELAQAIEAKIRRGRTLRELLKQERLSPLTSGQQLAWLIAYNEGLFDGIELPRIAARLARLLAEAGKLPLSLDDSRETWLPAIRSIFESMDREQPA